MKFLLDTHVFLWVTAFPQRLSVPVRTILDDPASPIYLSVASIWEMAIKHGRGRLDFPMDLLDRTLNDLGMEALPITQPHAIEAGALPRHHADPFDRMLIAQARREALTLVTADATLARYEVSILRT